MCEVSFDTSFFYAVLYTVSMENEKWFVLALTYLQRRPRSEHEVREYLMRKHTPDDLIPEIISMLKERKFLDDVEFARWWIEQRTQFRQKGKYAITIELGQKGVKKDVIDQAFASLEGELVSDLEKAKLLLRKKKEKFEHLPRQELYQKAGGLLARRGFGMDIIRQSIDETFGK